MTCRTASMRHAGTASTIRGGIPPTAFPDSLPPVCLPKAGPNVDCRRSRSAVGPTVRRRSLCGICADRFGGPSAAPRAFLLPSACIFSVHVIPTRSDGSVFPRRRFFCEQCRSFERCRVRGGKLPRFGSIFCLRAVPDDESVGMAQEDTVPSLREPPFENAGFVEASRSSRARRDAEPVSPDSAHQGGVSFCAHPGRVPRLFVSGGCSPFIRPSKKSRRSLKKSRVSPFGAEHGIMRFGGRGTGLKRRLSTCSCCDRRTGGGLCRTFSPCSSRCGSWT